MTDTVPVLEGLDSLIERLNRVAQQNGAGSSASLHEEAAQALTQLSTEIAAYRALTVDDPNWICAGVPDEAIDAGVAAWDAANEDMKPENYVAGETKDWDEGMIVAAIFKAVLRTALQQGGAQDG